MPTKIKVLVFEDAEQWIRDNIHDLTPDSVCSIHRISPMDEQGNVTYCDTYDESEKKCSMRKHVNGLKMLCEQIGSTLFVGMLKSPKQLLDPGNWDAEVVDAYRQLVYHGEVIYG